MTYIACWVIVMAMTKNKNVVGTYKKADGEKLFFKLNRESLTQKTFLQRPKGGERNRCRCAGPGLERIWMVTNSRRLDQTDAE